MDTRELTNRMARLVSLHEPRYGGPYQGHAAQLFVETMGEAMDTLASQAAEIERLRVMLDRMTSSALALADLLNPHNLPAGAEQQLEATMEQLRRARAARNGDEG